MKSSSGSYYGKLDHCRAVAAILVVIWHFSHAGGRIPFEYSPNIFLAVFEEGHSGVSFFMVISGYLFAKIIGDATIDYRRFLYNRILRLAPLLAVVFAYHLARDSHFTLWDLLRGFVTPAWPGGAWSITTELHFYLLLPLILAVSRTSVRPLLGLLAAGVLLRAYLHHTHGEVQSLAYWTIIGRMDQFVAGVLFFRLSRKRAVSGRGALAVGLAFLVYGKVFDDLGGFYGMPSYPSPSLLWVFHPLIEAIAFAVLVSWYDNSRVTLAGVAGRALAKVGEMSYSLYLLHFFVYEQAADFVARLGVPLENFPVALLVSILFVAIMQPLCWLSYTMIESPFLTLRVGYLRRAPAVAA